MKAFAKVVQFHLCNFLHRKEFFFDLLNCLRVGFFHFLREPESLDGIKYNNGEKDDEEQCDADLLEIADDRCDSSTEEIAGTGEYDHPKPAAYRIKEKESVERHLADPVKDAHRSPDTVNIFRDDDGKAAEFGDETLNSRLRHLIETIIFGLFVKHPADRIADAVSDHAAQSSCQKDLDERIPAKKTAMGHGAGDQKRYVALNGTESKNGIDTILLNDL